MTITRHRIAARKRRRAHSRRSPRALGWMVAQLDDGGVILDAKASSALPARRLELPVQPATRSPDAACARERVRERVAGAEGDQGGISGADACGRDVGQRTGQRRIAPKADARIAGPARRRGEDQPGRSGRGPGARSGRGAARREQDHQHGERAERTTGRLCMLLCSSDLLLALGIVPPTRQARARLGTRQAMRRSVMPRRASPCRGTYYSPR